VTNNEQFNFWCEPCGGLVHGTKETHNRTFHPITLLELASAILGRKAENGADFEEAHVAMWGGCEVCGASIAAYNGCPSRSGYIRCANACIGDAGFATVEEAQAFVDAGLADSELLGDGGGDAQ